MSITLLFSIIIEAFYLRTIELQIIFQKVSRIPAQMHQEIEKFFLPHQKKQQSHYR